MVKAALDCIVYQITDIVKAMSESAGLPIVELRVDGGPTKNRYLMQFQSDMLNIPVRVPDQEELSGIGAAFAAGLSEGIFTKEIFQVMKRTSFTANMDEGVRDAKYEGWKNAVGRVRS